MNFFKATLQLEGPNRRAEGSEKQSWLDPLIAVRTKVNYDDGDFLYDVAQSGPLIIFRTEL